MKTTISLLIFLFLTIGVNAQEVNTTNDTDKVVVTQKENTDTLSTNENTASTVIEDEICYAELSKRAFYEALIRQGGFQEQLNEEEKMNTYISLKNTEEIITNNKERISYSE